MRVYNESKGNRIRNSFRPVGVRPNSRAKRDHFNKEEMNS